jgi:hypothetical protein
LCASVCTRRSVMEPTDAWPHGIWVQTVTTAVVVSSANARGVMNSCSLVLELFFGDPTGLPAEPSDVDGNPVLDELGPQINERRTPDAVDVFGDTVVDEIGRLAKHRDLRLVTGFDRPTGGDERYGGARRVVRSEAGGIKDPRRDLSLRAIGTAIRRLNSATVRGRCPGSTGWTGTRQARRPKAGDRPVTGQAGSGSMLGPGQPLVDRSEGVGGAPAPRPARQSPKSRGAGPEQPQPRRI